MGTSSYPVDWLLRDFIYMGQKGHNSSSRTDPFANNNNNNNNNNNKANKKHL